MTKDTNLGKEMFRKCCISQFGQGFVCIWKGSRKEDWKKNLTIASYGLE
jgi:hypothetical protein